MPSMMSSYDPTGNKYMYKLYSKEEIKRSWVMLKRSHMFNIEIGAPYVICKVGTETDALILSALIMRKAKMPPTCTYYKNDSNLLFVNGNYLDMTYDEVREHCDFIFQIYLGMIGLYRLSCDLEGDPIFEMPDTALVQDPISVSNIHEHIHPEYAGVI